jgi:hypothetical protein
MIGAESFRRLLLARENLLPKNGESRTYRRIRQSIHDRGIELAMTSSPPETMRVPSGENATLVTLRVCPLKGSAAALPSSVHNRTVPSLPPETICIVSWGVPFGVNAA